MPITKVLEFLTCSIMLPPLLMHDAAPTKQHDPRGDLSGLSHIVGNQYRHGIRLTCPLRQLLSELVGGATIKSGEGLVQQQQLGFVQRRTRQCESLFHPPGETADQEMCLCPKTDALQSRLDIQIQSIQLSKEAQVLERREVLIQKNLVREKPDVLSDGFGLTRILSVDSHLAR